MIKLDIVIPTYNRPDLLEVTLTSIAAARLPADLSLTIFVADNNSSPANQAAYQAAMTRFPSLTLVYLFEKQQGRSFALNLGVSRAQADFIGFIDDDEKIDVAWLEVVAGYLRKNEVDYLGGPYKPDWEAAAPEWLPVHLGKYKAVLGWIEQSDRVQPFDDFGGSICGGNCIIRRSALNKIGGFSTSVGRSASNLMGGEDDELQRNLRLLGYRGMYDPALIIYHFIPLKRMTRSYHLRWAFWSGASNGVRLHWLPPEPVATLLGIPRYRYSMALSGFVLYLRMLASNAKLAQATRFSGLLDTIYLFGLLYGRHFIGVQKK